MTLWCTFCVYLLVVFKQHIVNSVRLTGTGTVVYDSQEPDRLAICAFDHTTHDCRGPENCLSKPVLQSIRSPNAPGFSLSHTWADVSGKRK
jgi:hypothetical protein